MAQYKKQSLHTLPCSIEAEQAVLGCILISEEVANDIFLKLNENDFYASAHKQIYRAMYNVYISKNSVDYVTLVSELETNQNLGEVGGISYIASLTNAVPSSANYKHYCDIVLEKSKLRKISENSQRIVANINYGASIKEIEQDINGLSTDIQKGIEADNKSFQTVAEEIKTELLDVMDNGYKPSGIPLGYKNLSQYLESFHKGEYYVIAARPSVGKTAFMLNILNDISIKQGYKSLLFSLEMTKKQNTARIMANVGDYSSNLARMGRLPKNEKNKIEVAYETIKNAPVVISDKGGSTMNYIRNRAMQEKKKNGLDIVFIDHLGLISSSGENRTQEVGKISRAMKILAKDLDVPVVCAVQLNRSVETRENKEPQLHDLRDTGDIEQDADVIMFLQRLIPNTSLTNDDEISKRPTEIPYKIIIAKQRDGATGYVDFLFYPMRQRFVEKNKEIKLIPANDREIKEAGDVFNGNNN